MPHKFAVVKHGSNYQESARLHPSLYSHDPFSFHPLTYDRYHYTTLYVIQTYPEVRSKRVKTEKKNQNTYYTSFITHFATLHLIHTPAIPKRKTPFKPALFCFNYAGPTLFRHDSNTGSSGSTLRVNTFLGGSKVCWYKNICIIGLQCAEAGFFNRMVNQR